MKLTLSQLLLFIYIHCPSPPTSRSQPSQLCQLTLFLLHQQSHQGICFTQTLCLWKLSLSSKDFIFLSLNSPITMIILYPHRAALPVKSVNLSSYFFTMMYYSRLRATLYLWYHFKIGQMYVSKPIRKIHLLETSWMYKRRKISW